ncbi:MAG: DNA primase [Pseudorhodobacter sp.]
MSLPPGFLDELRNRISLSQVIGRKVTWDARKSNQGKGDWWAPCPFHQEKTASFHVDDRKGFYYCFGCHAKGDALTFLRDSENLNFMEAVEMLAREAGMQMPARDPAAAKRADRRSQLAEVMEEGVRHLRLQLRTGTAQVARDYLERRGLDPAAQERWEIGWSPNNRQGLFTALQQKGFATDLIVDSGLCARADDGSVYDRFRSRIIFPIRDGRGRAISLGGRSLDPNARAKYLNGPETELFDKGRSLFNLARAREAAGKGQSLIVAEGYMDVIALSEAGFAATVAPLGTAITEDQLRLIWRIHDEPVIALDGDTAGLRAAMRAMDLALPLLEAGKGLRFALMPQGLDPDDLIKAQGAGAMRTRVDAAQPMVNLLWQRETEGKVFDSPERKAALDKTLRLALQRIRDPSIRGHYGQEIKRLRQDLFGARGQRPTTWREWQSVRPGRWRAPAAATPMTRASALANGLSDQRIMEQIILATLITHPGILAEFEPALERLQFSDPEEERLKAGLLHHLHEGVDDNPSEALHADHGAVLENLLNQNHVKTAPPVRKAEDSLFARMCLAGDLAKLEAAAAARREIAEAAEDLSGLADEGVTWRLAQINEARFAAQRGPQENKQSGFVAENGVEMDREELKEARSLWDRIQYSKGKQPR